MATVRVLDQPTQVFEADRTSALVSDIESLKSLGEMQKRLGEGIAAILSDEGVDSHEKAIARACLDDAHGRMDAVRSPREVQARLGVFEITASDPNDAVLHVRRPNLLFYGAVNLHGETTRTISPSGDLRVKVGGDTGTSLSARQVHDGFFTAEEVKNPGRPVHEPLLVGRRSIQGFLQGLSTDMSDQDMSTYGRAHEVADIHGQLLRHGIDASELDPDFADFVTANQDQVRQLGEKLLRKTFELCIADERKLSRYSLTREGIQERLLCRTVDTAKVLGVTQESADTLTVIQSQSDEALLLRQKVVTALAL